VADLLVNYTLLRNLAVKLSDLVELVERYSRRLERLGDCQQSVLIGHHQVWALTISARFHAAHRAQEAVSRMAHHLNDIKSKAYSLAGEILVSTVVAPKSETEWQSLRAEAISKCSGVNDAYIQGWMRNINLVTIGDYEHPKVRFPGSFGSAYLYYVVPKVILFRVEHPLMDGGRL
jgi:hypothetical protein